MLYRKKEWKTDLDVTNLLGDKILYECGAFQNQIALRERLAQVHWKQYDIPC